ncbi:hypothetical protein GGTG_03581 [Gaeumannomyces tritici R3-111a-1]|uniref:Peptide hydrolase n=1 Tax=Gaeumannomyces tritici (strain R3-111a-1) TaxID=644352 RepID=J3NQM5_GAET3|nr:hypothetical protein GGTG_03581 [Gaeumannomyces tritici R3-111a-1]EJT78481.1 hypothetical protein GGTG_03581 [Gaeumannomyces tritici R3-111a-1]
MARRIPSSGEGRQAESKRQRLPAPGLPQRPPCPKSRIPDPAAAAAAANMKFFPALLALAACLDTVHAVPSKRQSTIEPAALQALITEAGLKASIDSFQQVATANGGNRAFGRPGYDASVKYVTDRLSKLGAGVTVRTQDFTATYSSDWVGEIALNGAAAAAFGVWYSPSTPEGGLTAQLVDGPAGAAACDAAGYAGRDVRGKVVLVERGPCPSYGDSYLEGRMLPAAAAGAAGVVIFSNLRSTSSAGGFSRAPRRGDIPTGFMSQADGLALRARLQRGEGVTIKMKTGNVLDRRVTQNVIAETVGGDSSKTIIFGAHLDSVAEGPGINDNASGSSLVLELVTALSKLATSPRYKIRFAWWGAEERGAWGSEHYTKQLSASEAADVLAYVNFDMVGRGLSGVFDGDGSAFSKPGPAGSGAIQKLLTQGFEGQGLAVTPVELTERTDYRDFWRILNKPVGGTHSGVSQDPCYHRACDTAANVNITTLTAHTKAAAYALAVMAMKGLDV